MARKASDVVQVNLRVREAERVRLVDAARKARAPTFNGFIAGLLMDALEQERWLDADQIVANTVHALEPLLGDLHELNVSGDYRRAVGKLLGQLRPLLASHAIEGRAAEALRASIDEIDVAERTVEIELGRRLARMHTTGKP